MFQHKQYQYHRSFLCFGSCRQFRSKLRSCLFSYVYASDGAACSLSVSSLCLVFFCCSAPADMVSHEQHKGFAMKIVRKFARRSHQATDNYCFLLLMFLLSTNCFNDKTINSLLKWGYGLCEGDVFHSLTHKKTGGIQIYCRSMKQQTRSFSQRLY